MAPAVEPDLDPVSARGPRGPCDRPGRVCRMRSTVPCSRTPARTRCSTYSRDRFSITIDSMPGAMEQVRQEQPSRPGADDPDLGAASHQSPVSRRASDSNGVAARPAQHDVEPVRERPLRNGSGSRSNRAISRSRPPRVRDRVVDRVERQQRIAREVHLGDEPLLEGLPEEREVDVRGSPGVRVVAPRIGARLDRDEAGMLPSRSVRHRPMPVKFGSSGAG